MEAKTKVPEVIKNAKAQGAPEAPTAPKAKKTLTGFPALDAKRPNIQEPLKDSEALKPATKSPTKVVTKPKANLIKKAPQKAATKSTTKPKAKLGKIPSDAPQGFRGRKPFAQESVKAFTTKNPNALTTGTVVDAYRLYKAQGDSKKERVASFNTFRAIVTSKSFRSASAAPAKAIKKAKATITTKPVTKGAKGAKVVMPIKARKARSLNNTPTTKLKAQKAQEALEVKKVSLVDRIEGFTSAMVNITQDLQELHERIHGA